MISNHPYEYQPLGCFLFGGDGVCFAWEKQSAPFFAACVTAPGFFYALPKNSPPDCFTSLCSARSLSNPAVSFSPNKKAPFGVLFVWRRRWDSNPRYREVQLISSQSRYDHFDTSPYMRLISQALLIPVWNYLTIEATSAAKSSWRFSMPSPFSKRTNFLISMLPPSSLAVFLVY